MMEQDPGKEKEQSVVEAALAQYRGAPNHGDMVPEGLERFANIMDQRLRQLLAKDAETR